MPDYCDTFIENQFVSFAVEEGDMSRRSMSCTIRSTFEFLDAKRDASVVVRDSEENPLLVVRDVGRGQTAYLNMCAHNCLTPFPLRSPVESNQSISHFLADFALWFGREQPPGTTRNN